MKEQSAHCCTAPCTYSTEDATVEVYLSPILMLRFPFCAALGIFVMSHCMKEQSPVQSLVLNTRMLEYCIPSVDAPFPFCAALEADAEVLSITTARPS